MNPHIEAGMRALAMGDRETATNEFLSAFKDNNPVVRRIAENRLLELHPEPVYGSTASWNRYYHRPNCTAKNAIWDRNLVRFRDAQTAEMAGYNPCPLCKPPFCTVYNGYKEANSQE